MLGVPCAIAVSLSVDCLFLRSPSRVPYRTELSNCCAWKFFFCKPKKFTTGVVLSEFIHTCRFDARLTPLRFCAGVSGARDARSLANLGQGRHPADAAGLVGLSGCAAARVGRRGGCTGDPQPAAQGGQPRYAQVYVSFVPLATTGTPYICSSCAGAARCSPPRTPCNRSSGAGAGRCSPPRTPCMCSSCAGAAASACTARACTVRAFTARDCTKRACFLLRAQ